MERTQKRYAIAVSLLGSAILLPWAGFMGIMFTFSFSSNESVWAWIFDIVTYWLQIPAVLFSSFRPRQGALWMIGNIALSALIGIGFLLKQADANTGVSFNHLIGIIRTAFDFWVIPLIVALLLLLVTQSGERPFVGTYMRFREK